VLNESPGAVVQNQKMCAP